MLRVPGTWKLARRTAVPGTWRRTVGSAGVVAVFVPPLLLLVSGSLHRAGQPPRPTPDLIPDPVTASAYSMAWPAVGSALVNSLLVAAVAVPVSVVIASLTGFALVGVRPLLRRVIIAASLVALMIPATALLVPRFVVFRVLGLTDSLIPLMAPALIATSPLYPLVYYLAFRALPADFYDVCRLQDLSPLQTWWRMAMPQVRPVTAAVAALTFVLTWSNFLDPLVYLYDRDLFTVPLALRSLATLDSTDFPVFLAGAVIATIPALIVFGIAQRGFLHRYQEDP